MDIDPKRPEIGQDAGGGGHLPRAISLREAAQIAGRVQKLVKAGREHSAWELLQHLHPADIGSIVASLPGTSRHAVVRIMSPETLVWMLRQTNPLVAARVGTRLGARTLTFALSQVHPSHALAALRRIPAWRQQEVVQELEAPSAAGGLLAHAPDTAGSLMTTEMATVDVDGTAKAARVSLEALEDVRHKVTHVYAVAEGDRLAGQISMVDLALADDATPVRDIAAPPVAVVGTGTPAEECVRLRRHYNLTQLPVIDGERLIGAVLPEALLSATVEHDTNQMESMANVKGEAADGPLGSSVRARLPWLTANLGTTFLAAATIALFESTLAQAVLLAAFLPVVAGQGGIGGTQTLTLIVRAMALGELVGITAQRLLVREAVLGLLHGVWLGLLVAAIAIVWKQNVGLGLVLGLAMLGNMVIAGTVGAAVPLLMRRMGLDPAVASAVVVTTFTDVFGFLLFLGIATAAISLIQ